MKETPSLNCSVSSQHCVAVLLPKPSAEVVWGSQMPAECIVCARPIPLDGDVILTVLSRLFYTVAASLF